MDINNKLPHWVDVLANNVLVYLKKKNLTQLNSISLWVDDNKNPTIIRNLVTFELVLKQLKKSGINFGFPHISFIGAPEDDEKHCKNLITKLSTLLTPDATSNYELENTFIIKFSDQLSYPHTTENEKGVTLPSGKIRVKGLPQTFISTNQTILNAILDCFETDLIRWLCTHQNLETTLTFNFDEDIFKLYKLFDETESRYFQSQTFENTNQEYERTAYQYAYISDSLPSEKPFRADFLKLSTLLQMYDLDISSAYAYHIHLLKSELEKSCFSKRSEKIYNWLNNFAPDKCKFSINKQSIEISLNEKELSFMKKIFNFIKSYEDEVEFEDMDEIGKRFEMFAKENTLDYTHAKAILYKHLIGKTEGPSFSSFIKYLDRNKLLMLLRK